MAMEEKLVVEVRTYEGGDYRFAERIERTSIRCPFCETIVMPTYMLMTDVDNHRHNVFCQCPNCRETLVLEYERFNMSEFRFKQIHPNPTLKKEIFSDTIKEISPSFTDIYNQAYGAFQLGLNHVCGMGFRKALEFLIKDYAIRKRPDAEESYEYILAIANSPVIWWYLKLTGDTLQGDARTFKTEYLSSFPLPENVSEKDEDLIIQLVNKILEAKKIDINTDVSNLETALNRIIYRLYNLTNDEVTIIEKEMKL